VTRRGALLVALAVLAPACTTQSQPERNPLPELATTSTTSVGEPTDDRRDLLAALPGRLLILGPDHTVLTMRPDGTDLIHLAGPNPDLRRRTVPTWSPDASHVAWSDHLDDHTGILHITTAAGDVVLELAMDIVAEYIDWTPDGSGLAVMGNDQLGEFRLYVVGLNGDREELATGAPMSVDWDATGGRLLVRVQSDAEIIDVDGATRSPVAVSDATRLAAFVGGAIVTTRDADPGSILHVIGDPPVDILRFGRPAAYVVHPAGDRLAIVGRSSRDALDVADYATGGGSDDPVPALIWDHLTVASIDGGPTRQVDDRQTLSFSWSPDGTVLHWATIGTEANGALQWHAELGGSVLDYPTFVPGGDFARSYLAFFDQFERSVTLWSPDSRAWAYAGGQPGTTSAIWIQFVEAAEPIRVASGSYVTWSPAGR